MNRWEAQTEALAAIDHLAAASGCSRETIISALRGQVVSDAIRKHLKDIHWIKETYFTTPGISPDAEIEARR